MESLGSTLILRARRLCVPWGLVPWGLGSRPVRPTLPMGILHTLLHVYSIIVFIAVILSWFQLDPSNPVVRVTEAVTEPVLRPIRKVLPPAAGIDFSPLVLLLALQLLRRLI